MICEHKETGIRINVRRVEHTEVVEDCYGIKRDVVTSVEFMTDGGQTVVSQVDYPDCIEVKVATADGRINMFMVMDNV